MRPHRAIALFSGGLDSALSVVHMQRLGYEVIPIFFATPFFGPERALWAAEKVGIELRVIDMTAEHIEMLKNPVYGFGRNLNPCIDCHGLMFRLASAMIEHGEADFLISGEVLGQRPMSQRFDAMNAVRKLSGVKDLIIRPLSQKLLPDTLPIREGWVVKDEMLDIQGRTRHRQIELAAEFGISEYNTPGGGCLLTDKAYSIRTKDLIDHDELVPENLRFLRLGRHFRLGPQTRFILGKTSYDNRDLAALITGETVFKVLSVQGPMGVVQGELNDETRALAAIITLSYTSRAEAEAEVNYGLNYHLENGLCARKQAFEQLEQYRIH